MLKLFNSLWRSAARQTSKLQRKQTKKLIQKLVAPAPKKTSRPRRVTPLLAPKASWQRSRFLLTHSDLQNDIVAGTAMDYWLYQPSQLRTTAVPLIVMLHGCAQTAAEFAEGSRMNQLGESKGFGVLYPQQTVRMNPQRCWHWYKKPVQHGKGEAALIAALISQVVARHGFDPTRIYLAGISAGAAMAQIVGLHYPDLIAAVGLHSAPAFGVAHDAASAFSVMQNGGPATAPIDADALRMAAPDGLKIPAILIQGLNDSVVRPVNLARLEEQFCQMNGLTQSQRQPIERHAAGKSTRAANAFDTVDYRVGKQTLLRVCQIFGLQHAWSGGDAAQRFNERKGPDASRMMWNFFSKHRRQPVVESRASAQMH